MEFTYQIGDQTYIQRPLVLGQIRQLKNLMVGVQIPSEASTLDLVNIFGDRLPTALAVALTVPGQALKDKDLAELAQELEFSIAPEMALQVVEDFFDCNPVASLLEKLTGMSKKITKAMRTGSKTSASSSPEETLQNETPSSGDIPLENARPGSNSDPGTCSLEN